MSWWRRARAWLARRLGWPEAPGRWLDGHAFSWHGILAFRPWVFPRRHFRLYVPRGWARRKRMPIVVLIHGCRQTPDEFASGTRIAAAADRAGLVVLMPDQKDSANPYRCWNWFDRRTSRGMGEAHIVATMIRRVIRRLGASDDRVVVAGMSSGAALAAVLGVRFPGLVRGVFAHSGLPCGAASSAFTALTVMRRGPETDVAALAREARLVPAGDAHVALLVVQGSEDDVVARLNADALVRQFLVLDGIEVPAGANSTLPDADVTATDASRPDRAVRTREWRRDGRTIVRSVEIAGLGHAWSGGDAMLPFNDAAPPDATAMLVDWVAGLAQ